MTKWIVDTRKHESPAFFDINGEKDLKCFTLAEFESFLLEKRKTVGVSTLNGHRSALKDLYRRKNVPLPTAYEKNMATFFFGIEADASC
ncbi:hypothetical protein PC129_g15684 [Phytophthora cactorum]|uniref:Core-binding (CB) domain-containing protein n=1 Tax=Phytophthora cactorum TaxID=29920 RepID=A0A8T1HQA6_9STRA|nr:hypothetical protein Pcac1_g28498 [Phytophthora cactorum]KAG2886856.1 hypothetical protein PC114_g19069 [Phytophthora cactorum]KAG2899350.1 hypothetical protein PC115_g16547 [Phytophthora cactorum]KAG3078442.1 hypothetical protein PC122_g12699 [Phytophthora cactorum]KAG3213382.1 hypothetical protein PC129_g15684 [Phytophthora cactorum]